MLGPIEIYRRVRFKYFPKLIRRVIKLEPRADMDYIGTVYGGWAVPRSIMNPDTIVYCVGCGEDITFDLGVIEKFGCDVWSFDPTPRAIAHVEKELAAKPQLRSKYHFTPVGIWSEDKRTTFFMNDNPAYVSGSLVGLTGTAKSIEVDVRRLSTLMAKNGHDRVDVLKLDVEGAEYDVLEDILKSNIRPKWIGIDFDQPTPFKKTNAMIKRLRAAGYKLVEIAVWDYVFVRDDV